MKKRVVLPKLTIKYILKQIPAEEIFSYYWNISSQDKHFQYLFVDTTSSSSTPQSGQCETQAIPFA